jgi:hypothetical protein
MDMWTGNSRTYSSSSVANELDIGEVGEAMLEKRAGKNISTSG